MARAPTASSPSDRAAAGRLACRARSTASACCWRSSFAALVPVAREVDAFAPHTLATALLTALIAYEALHFREARARVRAAH